MNRAGFWLAIALGLLALPATAQNVRIFSIGTGGVAGTYYPIGGLVAAVISHPPGARPCNRGGNCGVENLIAIANSSDGSIANVNAIAHGTLDSGFVQSDVAFDAFLARASYTQGEAYEDLRLIASLYIEDAHIVTTGTQDVPGMENKRISLDVDGSGTQRAARMILQAHDLPEEKLQPEFVKPGDAVSMMRNGDLDGFIIVAGHPTPSVVEATRDLGATLVPLSDDAIVSLIEEQPYFSASVIPADTYPGQKEPIKTIGVVAQWLTSAKQDDDLIYEITKALWHPTSRQLLDNGHSRGSSITLDSALDGAAIPLHPGAERYYREAGLL